MVETQRKTPTGLGRRDKEDLKKRGTEWKGVRAIVRDHHRWKALCKPSIHMRRRGAAKWSNTDKNNKGTRCKTK
jgi:hypothetical protein